MNDQPQFGHGVLIWVKLIPTSSTKDKPILHHNSPIFVMKRLETTGGNGTGNEIFGGTLEAYCFGFGYDDFYALVDLPDNVTAAAASLVGNASGTIKATVTVLMTPAEADEAVKKTVDYRPPGH